MITAHQLEVRAGARLLMEDVSFRVGPGDKVGLVGRNGAGKTTLTKILAGEGLPASGQVTTSGDVGYLPQDPRTGDPEVLAKDRILSARGLDEVVAKLRRAAPDRRRRSLETDGGTGLAQPAGVAVIGLDQDTACLDLRVAGQIAAMQDRRTRHAGFFQPRQPIIGGAGA